MGVWVILWTMNAVLDDLATPRTPQQDRSRERFEKVVAEADKLLAESGLSGFSIPTLAERLGFTRRSIYMFFPTPYAVLNELTRRYIDRMQSEILEITPALGDKSVEELLVKVVFASADFHNRNPVGRLLILGGAVTDRSFKAQELFVHHLGRIARQLMEARGLKVPAAPPDIPAIAVEIGTSSFRLSHALHGEIIEEYKVEAAYSMLLYLAEFADYQVTRQRVRELAE